MRTLLSEDCSSLAVCMFLGLCEVEFGCVIVVSCARGPLGVGTCVVGRGRRREGWPGAGGEHSHSQACHKKLGV